MLEDYQEQLDEICNELREMAEHLDNIDKSDLSAINQQYLKQAIKLMYTANSACEEAGSYLDLE